jgi:regulator of protease activity HflC (stomatin/prohibitin superfamily)
LLRNGAVIGTAQPGLGFKLPMFDSVQKVNVKTVTYTVLVRGRPPCGFF